MKGLGYPAKDFEFYPLQMQDKRVLVLSVCLTGAAKIDWGNTGKNHGESFCNSEITL